ncbi:MAG: tetratricopeptide repeat protein [Leptolyngbyaceae cyanobacterium SL_7_1]|nr:tetratricopeptide repeat protein [Leptolyngbyaceae cyanobacterium SL_7_1]
METPDGEFDLVRQWLRQDELAKAEQYCWQGLSHNSQQAIALMLLGQIADRRQQWSTALTYFQRAIMADPTLAEAHNRLGNVLQRQRRFAEAIPYYQQAIAHQPDYVEAHSNLGAAYEEIDRYEESISCYQAALSLRPDYADAYYNLGNTYRSQGDVAAAVTAYRQAIALQPHYPMAHNNLGLALYDLAQPQAAIAEYDKAIALIPNNSDAHLNRGLARLFQGDLAEGFRDYEWRWRVVGGDFKPLPAFSQPQWDGSELNGKTILLWAEQGLGDTIQFIRYAQLVRHRGGRVIVECQPSLQRLLSTLPAVEQVIAQADPLPAFDTHIPLLSLPHALGTTLETVPAAVPYLQAPTPKPLTAPPGTLKVGIVWAGNPNHRSDRHRSCPFHHLLPLLQQPGVTFYSLQVGRSADLAPHLDSLVLYDLSPELQDFADTAAAIAPLDLVITVDTAVAHLAGALGKPVWILLSYAPDWRWLLDRSDTPWYPTARLFRQPQAGDWTTVIAQVITALVPLTSPPLPASPSAFLLSPPSPRLIGIGFPIGVNTGWRVYGLNLALQLLRIPGVAPAPLTPLSAPHLLNPIHRSMLTPTLGHQQVLQQLLDRHPAQTITGDLLVLKPLGNNLVTTEEMRRIFGQPTIGTIFFEDTHLTPAAIAQAERYDLIVAGSHWNAQVLRQHGIDHVVTVLQGIDPSIFHPAPAARWFGDRFVIFSGGKLEYRKGHDLVVAAFKVFHQRHADALLLTAWHNPWLETMAGLEQTGHVTGLPRVTHGQIQIKPWLVENGISPEATIDLGAIPNHLAGQILREADVAVFPNRAEGGTNLVAMESLACGIPTILSTNTGHQDLLGDHCYPLATQGQVRGCALYRGTDGWGESLVEEIVETLETIYTNRPVAQQRGAAAHQFMQDWTWEKQVNRLLAAIALCHESIPLGSVVN